MKITCKMYSVLLHSRKKSFRYSLLSDWRSALSAVLNHALKRTPGILCEQNSKLCWCMWYIYMRASALISYGSEYGAVLIVMKRQLVGQFLPCQIARGSQLYCCILFQDDRKQRIWVLVLFTLLYESRRTPCELFTNPRQRVMVILAP
jgi:hypothetical protein